MSKPYNAVWVKVSRRFFQERRRWDGEDQGEVLLALECGHWKIVKQSREPKWDVRVSCLLCTQRPSAAGSIQLNRHGTRVYHSCRRGT